MTLSISVYGAGEPEWHISRMRETEKKEEAASAEENKNIRVPGFIVPPTWNCIATVIVHRRFVAPGRVEKDRPKNDTV
ncbi:hypothetical protein Y032_0095g2844 [Ancylostoma ceylanicum]|uniref:Uncharacterized protein n=1 Tax=Ancylostoma ceylanicum TaxID=53326 RepID=A0A016TJV6_9BILA|nr:hypothetical protein Y032_0095g2844 [Ancylostoma ceylanicum]